MIGIVFSLDRCLLMGDRCLLMGDRCLLMGDPIGHNEHLRKYSIPPVRHPIICNVIGRSHRMKNVFRSSIGSRLNSKNIKE
jgi:hypothetical protein